MASGDTHKSTPAPGFADATVAEVMNPDVVWCTPETPLRQVAREMSSKRMHSVVVGGLRKRSSERSWGVVSDVDLLQAASSDLDRETAGTVAATELPTVSSTEELPRAAQIMAEHEVTHLIVVDPDEGEAVGVISSLDVARVMSEGAE
ncbi:MAG: CBS domain-containing protein [Solirubrobacterales bacterium]